MMTYIVASILWMVKAHPYQNTFFNQLVGKNWIKKFDVDYWGLSNLNAMQTILSSDKREKIYLKDGAYNFLPLSISLLNEVDARRVFFTADLKEADYIITNYRLNQTNYALINNCWKSFSDIKVGSEFISSTYKNIKADFGANLNKGAKILFSKNDNGSCLLGKGWSTPEAWGVWADDSSSIIRLPMADTKVSAIKLTFKALVSSKHNTQRIEISINGKNKKEFILHDFESNELIIPLTQKVKLDQYQPSILLEIHSINPVSPGAIGVGQDTRRLSVGLISIEYL
jgi:hypothetical protein